MTTTGQRIPFSVADLIPPALILALLTFLGAWNFLLFHTLVELFGILVSMAAFLMIWNLRQRMENGLLLFLALAYASVSMLTLFHLLAFKGMALFYAVSPNQSAQLWIASRYMLALSLLAAPLFASRPAPARPLLVLYVAADLAVLLAVFRPWPFLPAFPDCYAEGALPLMTPFMKGSERILGVLVPAAMGLLWLRRTWLDPAVLRLVLTSLAALFASDLILFGYGQRFDASTLCGHLLGAFSFWLVYKALVEVGLVRPFDVLFRNVSQSRQQVLESEERFRTLSSATFEGIAITENGRIVDVNEQLLAMLGRSRDEMVGEPVSAFLMPEDRERVLQGIREGLETQVEHRMVRKDGVLFNAEAHGKMVHFKNRTVRVTAIRDITERKRTEESLLNARNTAVRTARELARSNRDLEQFAHVTSHDLKEPLRMVTGFMGLLSEQYAGGLDEKGREYIRFATDAARRMQRLIDDLLEYCRIGGGDSPEPVPLGEALDGAVANLGVAFKESGAVLTRDPLPTLRVNRVEMIQLFQNLISNALKFRSDRPPAVHVGARRLDGAWEFSVRDNGIGIDPAYRDRLFKLFQRLQPAEDYPGSGVGLAICKKIVEQHGGEIRVESAPGGGSVFSFTLPTPAEGGV
jgi:PAS domain S-box-containing protein